MPISRRDFVTQTTSCAAHLALFASIAPKAFRDSWARMPVGRVVAREPFGNLEQISDGVWALISTPLTGDSTTVSNGGIVVGKNAVLAIEGFNRPAGALWLAGKARELTGRWPTHIALTHYHSDHANGVAGYLTADAHPVVRSTEKTRDLVLAKNLPADASRTAAVHDAVLLSATDATTLDLGGRTIRVIPRSGHTDSDVSLEIEDPSIVFCGDLFWNAMFPNFVDAIPTQLAKSVRALRRAKSTTYIPGHGAVGHEADYDRYVSMLDEVERGAKRAHEQGLTAADAGAKFTLPPSLGDWTLFSKGFYAQAMNAWYKELGT